MLVSPHYHITDIIPCVLNPRTEKLSGFFDRVVGSTSPKMRIVDLCFPATWELHFFFWNGGKTECNDDDWGGFQTGAVGFCSFIIDRNRELN